MTSQQHQSYKNDESNRMFKTLIDTTKVEPHRVLHIGDSASDVLGAQREGMISCWLNRNNQNWKHDRRPDLTVNSLEELINLLK